MTNIEFSAHDFRWSGKITTDTGSLNTGDSWSDTYTGVRSIKIAPLKSNTEDTEFSQSVFTEKNTWIIRGENFSIIPNKMAYEVGSKRHHITNVRKFKGSRKHIAIDTICKDFQ